MATKGTKDFLIAVGGVMKGHGVDLGGDGGAVIPSFHGGGHANLDIEPRVGEGAPEEEGKDDDG